nr:bZIP transcription factor 16-like isoform X5 [Ipomoea trifida]
MAQEQSAVQVEVSLDHHALHDHISPNHPSCVDALAFYLYDELVQCLIGEQHSNPHQAECDMAQRAEALKEEINRIKSDYEQLLAQNASLIRHISFGRFRRLCSPVSSNSGRQPSTSPSPAMIA